MNEQGSECDETVINWVFECPGIIVKDPLAQDEENVQGKEIESPPIIILDNDDKDTCKNEDEELSGLAASKTTVMSVEEYDVMEQEDDNPSPCIVANSELCSAASLAANNVSSDMVTDDSRYLTISQYITVFKDKGIDSGSSQETDVKTVEPVVCGDETNSAMNLCDTVLLNNEEDASINIPDIIDLIDDDSGDAIENASQAIIDFRLMNGGTQSVVHRTESNDENEEDVDDPGSPHVLSLRIEDVRSTSYQEFNLEGSADSGTLNHVAPGISEGSARPTELMAQFSSSSVVINCNKLSPDIIEITSDEEDDDDLSHTTVAEDRQQSDEVVRCKNTEVRPRVRLKKPENLLISPVVDETCIVTNSLLLPGTLICDLCKTQFDSKDDLFNHYTSDCIDGVIDKDFWCDKCDRVFKGPYNLKLHICLQNSIQSSDSVSASVKRRKKTTKFMNHRLDKGFNCEQCNMVFTEFNEFGHHILMHNKKFFCGMCSRAFTKKENFLGHIRAHYGFLYECTYCRKGYELQSELVRHIRIHTGDKPYKCPFDGCLREFANSSGLTVHHRVHTAERPYKCSECNKAYTQIGYLKKHKCVKPEEPLPSQSSKPRSKRKPQLSDADKYPPMPIIMSVPFSITNPYTQSRCAEETGINISTSNDALGNCHEPPRILPQIKVNKAIIGNF